MFHRFYLNNLNCYILLLHTDGLVSLWSESGSEVSQYNRRSTACLLTGTEKQVRLVLARNNVDILCPTESQCEARYSGHHGPLASLTMTNLPGVLITSGLDGKVKQWSVSRAIQSDNEVRDEIVAVSLTPAMLSLSKSGVLTLWTKDSREDSRVEARSHVVLEGDKYRMMDVTVAGSLETLMLVTCKQLGHIQVGTNRL